MTTPQTDITALVLVTAGGIWQHDAFVITFDELAKCCYTVGEILEKQMTVGEFDKLVGEIRQRKGKLLLTIPEKPRSSHQRFFSKVN